MVTFLIIMTLMVFTNTALRYTLNTSIISSEEISRFLFIWAIFIGGILAVADNIHIQVDVLTRKLSPKIQKFLVNLSNFLIVVVCIIMAIGGWTQTVLNVRNFAPATNIPLAWVNVSCFIAGVGMGGISLYRLVKGLRQDKDGRAAE